MKQRMCWFLFVVVQIISLVHASSTSSLQSHHIAPQPDTVQEFLGLGVAFDSKQVHTSLNNFQGVERKSRKLGRLGSRPPNCQHKCGRCTPCVAIQIPATTDKLGTQYTNYKPEGWKCKCNSAFFNP